MTLHVPHIYLIRGLPGSGKSTLAARMAEENENIKHIEADQFFYGLDGKYLFDRNHLAEAHHWCLDRTIHALRMGYSAAVSNTFSQLWEMRPYIDLDQPFTVITCEGNYGSIHAPQEVRARMVKRWESYP